MVDGGIGAAHAAARREAEALAGDKGDLARRALGYHHLYRHSAGNHVFPLVAAHGALWGKGYFALGQKVGLALSLPDLWRPSMRRARLEALSAFADAFREINRRVFVEVWSTYLLTATHGDNPGIEAFVDPVLLDALNRCHNARRTGVPLDRAERGSVFEAFFRWEQREVVGPSVDAAVAAFDWPLARRIALTPSIRFAYIPHRHVLRFKEFASADERIEKGLRAYELAEEVGFARVETDLAGYGLLPAGFPHRAEAAFHAMREGLLPGAAAPVWA